MIIEGGTFGGLEEDFEEWGGYLTPILEILWGVPALLVGKFLTIEELVFDANGAGDAIISETVAADSVFELDEAIEARFAGVIDEGALEADFGLTHEEIMDVVGDMGFA